MDNNQITRSEYVLFELSNVTNEILELCAQFNVLEIDSIEKAVENLKFVLREYKPPQSDVFSITI